MMYQLTRKEKQLLIFLSKYEHLTIDQLTLLNKTGKRIIQKRVMILERAGLLSNDQLICNSNRGRPSSVLFLSDKGQNVLKAEGIKIKEMIPTKNKSNKRKDINHQLLVNWFKIYLTNLTSVIEDLEHDFHEDLEAKLTDSSKDKFSLNLYDIKFFIPDAVFVMDSKKQNKSLLFFLEVDMSTETISSNKNSTNTIENKIKNYREYFTNKSYKQFEKKWKTKFNGFRLLILTNTTKRKITLANLINSESSNDFIWVTDQNLLHERGVGSKIWLRGGRKNSPLGSILGPNLATLK
ncbi:MAG: replication-relaxation family protein [Melioribacteraceae bacterium]|nr:replication-relaxation family protein [Melioribacteraceae bacterium]MCF8411957.1 replication-relaxation family protein [Melioribacteraceae bacterium]